jgi:circadian clock protein KaiC
MKGFMMVREQEILIPTGVPGLDEILKGGLTPGRLYLLEGDPGSGKTTLALQFLREGLARGESGLLVTLSESKEELLASATSHGWDLGADGVHILELIASDTMLSPDSRYTMYHPSEVELGETIRTLLVETERLQPARLVFDSLAELRLMAENPLRYRHQILALKDHFTRRGTTVLLVDDRADGDSDMLLHSLAHGVIGLERDVGDYGPQRRRLQVHKLRGRAFSEGFHDFRICRGGLEVFPRLVAAEYRGVVERKAIPSGIAALDTMLGGGLAQGTSTLIMGAAGTGKSSLAAQYACAAVARGDNAAVFLFEESPASFRERSTALGQDLEAMLRDGRLSLQQVDPAELSPGEFAFAVRRTVEESDSKVIVIDSLNGYLNAMPSHRFLVLHLHELLTYLGQKGVTTLLLMAQHGLIGPEQDVPVDASYLADTVLLLRYFEALGEVRVAMAVIKKRTGSHERTLRELRLGPGLQVGEPLREFQGVLRGSPHYLGGRPPTLS